MKSSHVSPIIDDSSDKETCCWMNRIIVKQVDVPTTHTLPEAFKAVLTTYRSPTYIEQLCSKLCKEGIKHCHSLAVLSSKAIQNTLQASFQSFELHDVMILHNSLVKPNGLPNEQKQAEVNIVIAGGGEHTDPRTAQLIVNGASRSTQGPCGCQLVVAVRSAGENLILQINNSESDSNVSQRNPLYLGRSALPVQCPSCEHLLWVGVKECTTKEFSRIRNTLSTNKKPQKCAFASVIWGGNSVAKYVVDALVSGYSLKRTGTTHDLVLQTTEDIFGTPFAALLSVYWDIHCVHHIRTAKRLLRRCDKKFKHVFTKLNVMKLSQYSVVVMLDLDVLVREGKNLDDLFRFHTPSGLMRGHGTWTPGVARNTSSFYSRNCRQKYGINAGVIVFKPLSTEDFDHMCAKIANEQDPSHIATTMPEQDFLTRMWITEKIQDIGLHYNYQVHQLLLVKRRTDARIRHPYGHVSIVHYSADPKPRDHLFDGCNVVEELIKHFKRKCRDKQFFKDLVKKVRPIIQTTFNEWGNACDDMWPDVLNRVLLGPTVNNKRPSQKRNQCCLCKKGGNIDVEHCFFTCSQVQDLLYAWCEQCRLPLPVSEEVLPIWGTHLEKLREFVPGAIEATLKFVGRVYDLKLSRMQGGTSSSSRNSENASTGRNTVPSSKGNQRPQRLDEQMCLQQTASQCKLPVVYRKGLHAMPSSKGNQGPQRSDEQMCLQQTASLCNLPLVYGKRSRGPQSMEPPLKIPRPPRHLWVFERRAG